MKIRKSWLVLVVLTAVTWASMPETSHAQIFRGRRGGWGRGYDGGYYGGGYYGGGYYNGGAYYGSAGIDPCCCANGVAPMMQPGMQPMMQPGTHPQAGYSSNYLDPSQSITVNLPQNLPPNAQLYWNGQLTQGNGAIRRLPIPATGIDGNQRFEARWTGADGQPITQSREVRITPNSPVNLDFNVQGNGVGTNVNPPNPLPQK